jgi:hypothetical protein
MLCWNRRRPSLQRPRERCRSIFGSAEVKVAAWLLVTFVGCPVHALMAGRPPGELSNKHCRAALHSRKSGSIGSCFQALYDAQPRTRLFGCDCQQSNLTLLTLDSPKSWKPRGE